ncbi:hypothetical protein PPL_08561 [Heterostelium album PN500]|uniref:Uncharacterized protein n=1 Tax=Heterostelium pallidum (strain ATCC 26659 / Pp 5 / PN500) TaxID=670386 RepID=D3BJ39_HETP5|nr:hypothetical protein PPL_08561 [Heterostelium album PN500]EFA77919.1 hypothetical protein PPL_08561 [Heterostelium album PN500]|eukprot:XP_020430047.1 hypothetical protein PPL_08561 [Heterostelium album PN500]
MSRIKICIVHQRSDINSTAHQNQTKPVKNIKIIPQAITGYSRINQIFVAKSKCRLSNIRGQTYDEVINESRPTDGKPRV